MYLSLSSSSSSLLWQGDSTILIQNKSGAAGFLIVGFSDSPELQGPLFLFFLLIYLVTVWGNLLLISLISTDSHLQTPMYFFLCNLSCLDISYSSVTAPYLLHIFSTGKNYIPFTMCMVQLYFFSSLATMEYMLLTTMAYDRYVAICRPLFYPQVMNQRTCILLAAAAWIGGLLAGAPLVILISALTYCKSNIINHFFCDLTPLLKLSCDDTSTVEFVMFLQGVSLLFSCFSLTMMSYIYIISAILKITSVEGRYKTFSTCGSHLTAVTLFYILLACVYMKPPSLYSLDEGKVVSILYVNIIPMLNPIIYSLRNKDVKKALNELPRRWFYNRIA
ncbi:olfactory receptor 1019-like [Xenopus tropicalis]|uniref:Olfactory receptor n=1 Tax=Xenopus tropicalis TaxID=8364 RepID=F6YKY0_XENTR|nr:olfactory receptor 1019-like [Xenopus tropicalis]|eukprot:XP_004916496.1 PREDICTED: olfactory receptor 1019-like [Xenopus tropicalis]